MFGSETYTLVLVSYVCQTKKHSSLKENTLECLHGAGLTLMMCTSENHPLTFCVSYYKEGKHFPAECCFHKVGLPLLFLVFARL